MAPGQRLDLAKPSGGHCVGLVGVENSDEAVSRRPQRIVDEINGFVVIKLTPDAEIPDGVPDYAEVVEWNGPDDLGAIGDAIEHAAAAREKVPAMQAATPGRGSSCGKAA